MSVVKNALKALLKQPPAPAVCSKAAKREPEQTGPTRSVASIGRIARTHLLTGEDVETIEPHLLFTNEYFGQIYCVSLFTHIDDLAYTWLLELKRIMRPGGMVYITVHDKHTADLIMNHIDRAAPGGPDSQVFMTSTTCVGTGDGF